MNAKWREESAEKACASSAAAEPYLHSFADYIMRDMHMNSYESAGKACASSAAPTARR